MDERDGLGESPPADAETHGMGARRELPVAPAGTRPRARAQADESEAAHSPLALTPGCA